MKRIVVCEPLCHGIEHVTANAALLWSLRFAFPSAQITLLGERQHIEWVQEEMARVHPTQRGVDVSTPIWIPRNTFWGVRRLAYELRWCRTVLRRAAEDNADAVVVLTASHTAVIALKLLLQHTRIRTPVLAIMHSFLGDLLHRPPRLPWTRAVGIRNALSLQNPRGLRLVALGASILNELSAIEPGWTPQFRAMDLPYCFPPIPDSDGPADNAVVRFGCFGVVTATKGFTLFDRLARGAAGAVLPSEWSLVGFVRDEPDLARSYDGPVKGVTAKPLSPSEFRSRAIQVTYAVMVADPEKYRLIASASFLDTLAYVKPVVCLRNPYAEECFRRMGDIGYLCNTFDEMREVVRSLLSASCPEKYHRQKENILCGREAFAPQTIARTFRDILEELVSESGHDEPASIADRLSHEGSPQPHG